MLKYIFWKKKKKKKLEKEKYFNMSCTREEIKTSQDMTVEHYILTEKKKSTNKGIFFLWDWSLKYIIQL